MPFSSRPFPGCFVQQRQEGAPGAPAIKDQQQDRLDAGPHCWHLDLPGGHVVQLTAHPHPHTGPFQSAAVSSHQQWRQPAGKGGTSWTQQAFDTAGAGGSSVHQSPVLAATPAAANPATANPAAANPAGATAASAATSAATSHTASSQRPASLPTTIPALLLGDLFAPCNAIGLFQHHADLDELFGHMGHMGGPGAHGLAAGASRNPASATHPTHTLPLPLPSTSSFEQGVKNLKASRDKHHRKHPSGSTHPPHPHPPHAAGSRQSVEAGGPQGPGSSASAAGLVAPIDPSVQLLVRTVCPVNDRRLFFVSPKAADAIREALVLERHKVLQQQRAEQLALQSPLGAADKQGAPLGQVTARFTAWWGSMVDWLKTPPGAGTGPATAARQPSSSSATGATGASIGSSSGSGGAASGMQGQGSLSTSDATAAAAAAATSSQAPVAAASGAARDGRSPGSRRRSQKQDSQADPLIKGPLQVIPLVAQLVDAATQLGPAFDWPLMEERCVAAEAAHIQAGGQGRPPRVEGPTSFVGRVPLQAAFSLASASPSQFSCIVTGTDARLVREARGRTALMDLRAASDHRWVVKVEDEDESGEGVDAEVARQSTATTAAASSPSSSSPSQEQTGSPAKATRRPGHHRAPGRAGDRGASLPEHESESEDAQDDDMALTSLTPIFQVPGVTLSLVTSGGQRVALAPAFLSIAQLHVFVEASKALMRSMWLSGRKAQRAAFTRRLEGAALALSGLTSSSGLPGGGGPSAPSAPQEPEDDDEDGLGEPPEAKALLAELGEGRRPSGGGAGWAGGVGPLTGWPALVSTLAVGVVSAVGQVAAAAGDAVDHVTAHSPFALSAMGFPAHLAIAADYLEPSLEALARDNAGRIEAWRAHKRNRLARHAAKKHLPPPPSSSVSSSSQAADSNSAQALPAPASEQGAPAGGSGEAAVTAPDTGQNSSSGDKAGSEQGAAAAAADPRLTPPGEGRPSAEALPAVPTTTQRADSAGAADAAAKATGRPEGGTEGAAGVLGNHYKRRSKSHSKGAGGVVGGAGAGSGPTAVAAAQQLESLAGVAMLFQAAWAVLHDAHSGDAQLASVLASSWAGQAKVSASADGELSVLMTVQLHSAAAAATAAAQQQGGAAGATTTPPSSQGAPTTTPGSPPTTSSAQQPNTPTSPPTTTTPTPGQRSGTGALVPTEAAQAGVKTTPTEGKGHQGTAGSSSGVESAQQPQQQQQQQQHPLAGHPGVKGMGVGDSSQRVVAGVGSDNSLAALLALSLPPHIAAEAHTHKFEVGLHLNSKKLTGASRPTAADAVTADQTCLKGLLIIGDLGLNQDTDSAGGVLGSGLAAASQWRAPPLGYADLAHLLAAHQRQHHGNKQPGQEKD